jgi:SAM-dependent methyltransferase
VVNVGAGTGSYEPADREVVAVEPSAVMLCQRAPGAAPAVRAAAEALPFADGAFDASMAVLTDHHWRDRLGGLREMRRVAARRAVVFQFDPAFADAFWLIRDYLPEFRSLPAFAFSELGDALGATRVEVVPVPWDCVDGFFSAFWRRPEAYLEEAVRRGSSVWARVGPEAEARAVSRLRADLASGAWRERNADLLALDELDLGFRLLVAE